MTVARLDESARQRQRWRNRVHGVLVLAGMVLILTLCTWLIFGGNQVWVVAVLGLGMLALRPRMRPEWVLRMYRAVPLTVAAAPELHGLVGTLARRAGLPRTPRLYYVPSSMLNAFAVGRRDDAAIGVTDALLRQLSGRQITGVLAHEMSHIRSDDLWIMTLADTVARVTHIVTYTGLFLVLLFGLPAMTGGGVTPLLVAGLLVATPTVMSLLQLTLLRGREYQADLEAVALTGDPDGLAAALRTLERHEGRIWERIMVPHGRVPDPVLLRTHPSTEDRVRRLRELSLDQLQPVAFPRAPLPPASFVPVTHRPRLRAPGIWR